MLMKIWTGSVLFLAWLSFCAWLVLVCREKNVPVCDCYALWKRLAACGVDTTALLCNRINHPDREMHKMFAYELVKTVFSE